MPKYDASTGARGLVYLDGNKVNDVSECDTDEGYVIRAVRGDDGYIKTDGDNIITERLTGVVTFEATK